MRASPSIGRRGRFLWVMQTIYVRFEREVWEEGGYEEGGAKQNCAGNVRNVGGGKANCAYGG